jgi:hypothetical protein
MAKTGNSEKTTIPAKERTAKDHAKAVGNGLLGVGETLFGVSVLVGTVALIGVSGGFALSGSGVTDLFKVGFSFIGDGASRVSSPYGDKPKQTQPISQVDEEERRKLEQAKALSRSQTREQTTAIEQGRYSGKSNPMPPKQSQMSVPIALKGSQVVQPTQPKELEEKSPPRGMGAELLHKIKKNPWKTLGTVLLATAFPAGTVIAGAIAAGVVIKSGYDAYANKQESSGKSESPRGMGAELLHKIKKNPWKTLGTVLLATAFPAGTVIAGAIAAGVVAKSGYDAYVNKKASATVNPSGFSSTPSKPVIYGYQPRIAPVSTPIPKIHSLAPTKKQTHSSQR